MQSSENKIFLLELTLKLTIYIL